MLLALSSHRSIGDLLTSTDVWTVLTKDVLIAAGILFVTVGLSRLARSRLRAGLQRSGMQAAVAILLSRLLWMVVWLVGVAAVLFTFGVGLTPLAAFIGVVGLAASLALQQVLQNLVAGVYLLVERPFHIGDLIAVVGPAGVNHEGVVEDVQMRTTHLRNDADELILVPNSSIFAGVVTNRSAVGGYASTVSVTFPRSVDPGGVRERIPSVVEHVPGVLSEPGPRLRVDKVGKDDWTGSLVLWLANREAGTGLVWAVASAFPQATVNTGDGGSA